MKRIVLFISFLLIISVFSACGAEPSSAIAEEALSAISSTPPSQSSIAESQSQIGETDKISELLIAYNQIAKFPIEEVESGAYDFNNKFSINDVFIMIYDSDDKLFVDYELVAQTDEQMIDIFHDFCKAHNPSMTEEDFSTAVQQLRTGDYIAYSPYEFDGIKATYYPGDQKLSDENYRFKIKSELGTVE